MARKTSKSKRIEPKFEDKSTSGLRASARDRVGAAGTSKKTTTAKSRARRAKPKKGKRSSLWWRVFKPLTYWGLVFGLWGSIATAGIVGYYAAQLPSADTWAVPERPPNMRIMARDGSLIGNRGLTGGKALRLEDISPYIPQAVIAIEDRRFHAHFGFDPIGFGRAMTRNIMQGRMREGGSTLTQQLAKNLFLKPERRIGRKIQELILAVWLETKYSKAQILELYLNRVYFGAGATGVDAAANRYFGKSAKHVSIAEAALLAGLLKAPTTYSPARNPKLAQKRARLVLAAMQREGYVKPGKLDINKLKPGQYARHFRSGPEHFVADFIAKRASKLLGKVRSDVVVETTLDPFLMTAGHATLNDMLEKFGTKKRVSQAALVALAPNGAVRTLIGGRDYGKSQFNRAIDAKRQPGSAFKTFVWLNALERGLAPHSVVIDERVRYGKWSPANYDKKYRGAVTLNTAFSKSLNTIAAKMMMEGGPRNVAKTAHRLGIVSPLKANASLALGTSEVSLLELTSAYAPFANGGLVAKPYFIKRITDSKGRVLYAHPTRSMPRAVAARELGMMNAMLGSVIKDGTAKAAEIANHPAGGKTGTSQNFRDALFIGHTAHLVTGIWFGNDNNKPTRKLTGGDLPAKAWAEFMTVAHKGLAIKELPGDPAYLAALPTVVPKPRFRPANADRTLKTASVRERFRQRVKKVREKAKKSILGLIAGE